MPSSLTDAIAHRLALSSEEAEEHLRAFVSAITSEAARDEHATVPGLGTFSTSEAKALHFEPADALARAVNHSFSELAPVDLPAAPAPLAEPLEQETARSDQAERDQTGTETEAETEGSSFAPRPPEEPPAEEPPAEEKMQDRPPEEDGAGQEAGTEEAAPPVSIFSPSSSQGGTRDTPAKDSAFGRSSFSELKGSSTAGEPSASEPPPQEPSTSEAAAEEDAPDRALPSWSYGALPTGYLVHRYAAPAPSALRRAALHAPGAPAPHPGSAPAERAQRRERARKERSTEPPAPQTSRSGGSGLRWFVAVLVLLALILGIWYALGQQGIVTGPREMSQQSLASSEPSEDDGPGMANPSSNTPRNASGASQGNEAEGKAGSHSPASSRKGNTEKGAAENTESSAWSHADRIDRDAGGWTIIVASETSRPQADSTARTFARRFSNRSYPLDILKSTIDGTTRHRVAVGQFASQAQARQALDDASAQLPDDAWVLPL